MKHQLILAAAAIAGLAILSGCKTTPPPDMCSELTRAIPGEDLIPEPVNGNQAKIREAMICSMRACRLSELVDFDYRGTKPPRIWF